MGGKSVYYEQRGKKLLFIKLFYNLQKVGTEHDNFIMGDVKTTWPPVRHPANKYYVSVDEYDNATYPPFAIGEFPCYQRTSVFAKVYVYTQIYV